MNYRKEDLRPSLILSTCVHVGFMCVLYFGLPSFFEPPPLVPWKPVPVDIVDIGEITNTRIKNQKEHKAKRTPKKKPKPKKAVKKAEKPKPKSKTSVKEPPKPEKLKPDEVALPTKEKIKKKKPELKKKKPAPQPAEDPLASVLKNVAKLKPEPAAPTPDEVKKAVKESKGEDLSNKISQKGPALSDRLTISEEDALRRQISSCWNMPIGARHAENLIVEVLIEVNQDRTVRSAEVVDQMRMATDSYFRAAAEAALRALRHPRCTPLELPPDQYEQWKTIRFNFDPRDML